MQHVFKSLVLFGIFVQGVFAETAPPAVAGAGVSLQPAPVFADHAVLQQGKPIRVYGEAVPGAAITVTLGDQPHQTTVPESGRWQVMLDPLPADALDDLSSAPPGRTLRIVATHGQQKEIKEFNDVLIGEVWLCAGQSNMAGKVRNNRANHDPNDNLFESQLPAVRHYSPDHGWILAVPDQVGEFSRVGFCFAREVHRIEKVPIGLVNATKGGSSIESWMRAAPNTPAVRADSAKQRPYGNLFKERLSPLIGYTLRGALWYQGEANASEGQTYHDKMATMIADWRGLWGQGDFPFYYVQLAGIGPPLGRHRPTMGDGRAWVREAQRRILELPATGMAVATDIGDQKEHPANKVEVGVRLAHWALHHTYGYANIVPSGPLYQSHKIERQYVRIKFKYGQGLMPATKQDYRPPNPVPGQSLDWLSIQAGDGIWHWAEARIEGDELVVFSRNVVTPQAVRYGFTNRPIGVMLYNAAGLPASPFTTESTLP